MKKKIVIGLAMLITLTASLSAQAATLVSCTYTNNATEQLFELYGRALNELYTTKNSMFFTNNLPKPVIQVIGEALLTYTLHTGDVFIVEVNFQHSATVHTYFIVSLRITDA